LEVSQKIPQNITHIGIRAHNFAPASEDDVNVMDTRNATKLEMPFEWEITLANGLWWKVDKSIYEHDIEIPEYLKVDPKNIILLED
jgi:molybdate transport system ATP-binding protein